MTILADIRAPGYSTYRGPVQHKEKAHYGVPTADLSKENRPMKANAASPECAPEPSIIYRNKQSRRMHRRMGYYKEESVG